MLPIKTILFPTDFSETADAAFAFAGLLARELKARLIVVHVVKPVLMDYGEGGVTIMEPPPTDRECGKLCRCYDLPGIAVERAVVTGNDPAEEILRLARSKHADLIVLGTHGRTGLRRALLGSVAEVVLRQASCPVMTIKEGTATPESSPRQEAAGLQANLS